MSSPAIYDSIVDTIGNTPLVRLKRMPAAFGCAADIICKLEFFNPLGSVKDRIAKSMIDAAEADGRLTPATILVEPTSGNTGIALAFVCAARGYKLILTMPESMSIERRKLLKLLGAELELTAPELGMRGAIHRAEEIIAQHPNALMLQQFDNPANPKVHEQTTAEEIWRDTAGAVDALVVGIGTGGTFTGCSRVLKERKADLHMIAVEPEDSPILSGGKAGAHKIQGIGAGFVPGNLDSSYIDEVIQIANETAFHTAREAARLEGLPIGISSGATLAAALEIGARAEFADQQIVVIIASCAERYLSTELFSEL